MIYTEKEKKREGIRKETVHQYTHRHYMNLTRHISSNA
jgi:hypothetical protein